MSNTATSEGSRAGLGSISLDELGRSNSSRCLRTQQPQRGFSTAPSSPTGSTHTSRTPSPSRELSPALSRNATASATQSTPTRRFDWTSILRRTVACLTQTWLGNVVAVLALLAGLVFAGWGLYLQRSSWNLQAWTAMKDAKESCMHDKVGAQ